MRRRGATFTAVGVTLAVMTGFGWRLRASFMRKPPPVARVPPPIEASVTQLPLGFEINQGQFDSRVLYAAHTSDGTLFFTNDGLTLALPQFVLASPPLPSSPASGGGVAPHRFPDPRERLRKHPALESVTTLRLAFDGANPSPQVEAGDQEPGIKNYLIGRDPEKWHTHVPIFGKVAYRNLYPGIDLVFYGGKSGLLEYDLNVSRGANPDQIHFRFEGADRVELEDGDLLIHAGPAELRQPRPHMYAATVPRREIPVSYRIDAQDWIGLDVSKRDARDGLRIDPVLAYSTYLGGSGAGDFANSLALDAAGSVYVAGNVTSVDFPTTKDTLQPHDPKSAPPMPNIGISTVTKLDPTGGALVYSTYIGGDIPDGGIGDEADAIFVTDAGFAYVAGQSGAPDFPVTDGGAQTIIGGLQDGYVLELAPAGDRLIYSSFLGGPDLDVLGAIDLDADGNAYVAGFCFGSHFPTSDNALQGTFGGSPNGNGIFAKLSPDGTRFVYKSYFGGSGSGVFGDQLVDIKVDSLGQPLLLGNTPSDDVPGHAMSPVPFHDGGGGDAYLTRLTSDGQTQISFTYLGGSGVDWGFSLGLDPLGNAWIVGETGSADFPVTNDAWQKSLANPPDNVGGGPFDAFVAVLDPDAGLFYSTYLGGSGDDRALGVALDTKGHAHIFGITTSTDLVTINAIRGEHDQSLGLDRAPGNGDMFLADLTIDGGLDFLSYIGGSGAENFWEWEEMIAVDSFGATYVVGNSTSQDFPVTTHAFQHTNNAPAGATNMVIVKVVPTPPPSTLTVLQPNVGPSIGLSVVAEGTNLSAQCELDFGGIPSTIVSANPNQLDVVTPAHACGPVDVTLSCPGSPPFTLPDGFTFEGCPDSGPPDAGPLPDAGPTPDAGPLEHTSSVSSCGCGSIASPVDASCVLGLVLLAMVRHRRRRRNP